MSHRATAILCAVAIALSACDSSSGGAPFGLDEHTANVADEAWWGAVVPTDDVPYDDAIAEVFANRATSLAESCKSWAGFVVHDGDLVHVTTSGTDGPREPVLLASVSKTVIVVLALRLAAAGTLDLDRPIMEIFAANAALHERYAYMLEESHQQAVTARLLLAHRSGLAPNGSFGAKGLCVAPPDTVSVYSNLGYHVLFDVLREVSGQTLPELLRRELTTPTGIEGFDFPDSRYAAATFGRASPLAMARMIRLLVSGGLVSAPTWPDDVLHIYGGMIGLGFQVQHIGDERIAMQEGVWDQTRNSLSIWDRRRDAAALFCTAAPQRKPPTDMRNTSWLIMHDVRALPSTDASPSTPNKPR